MLPWLRVMPLPEAMTKGSWERAAKAKSSPTAVRTEGSITPVGGTIKPATIRPVETANVMANTTVWSLVFIIVFFGGGVVAGVVVLCAAIRHQMPSVLC